MPRVFLLTLELALRKQSLLICAMICFRAAVVEASYRCSQVSSQSLVLQRPDWILQNAEELALCWGVKGRHTQTLRINGGSAGNPRDGKVSFQVVSIAGVFAFLVLIHLSVPCEDISTPMQNVAEIG